MDNKVASVVRAKIRYPLASQRSILPDCIPSSNLIRTFPVTVSISFVALILLRDTDIKVIMQVVALAFEGAMLFALQ